jgi:hypothetical protein
MFSTKITLLSLALPLGTWQAWTSLDQSHLVIRVAVAVAISFGIFMAILGAMEYATVATRRARIAALREPVLIAHIPGRRRAASAT